jgi:hypothetical protein
VPDTTTTQQGGERPTQALAALLGDATATQLVKAGWDALQPMVAARPDLLHPGVADTIAATVLIAAVRSINDQGFTLDGVSPKTALQMGATHAASLRRAELAAIADTVRAAYLAVRANRHNPAEALIRFADAAGVDLSGDGPAAPGRGEFCHTHFSWLCQARQGQCQTPAQPPPAETVVAGADYDVLTHETPGRMAYRFTCLGVGLAGNDVEVTMHGGWWHAKQTVDGAVYEVDAEDRVALVLALIAKRYGLAAVFAPDDAQPPPPNTTDDPLIGMVFNAISSGSAKAGRFISLSERRVIAEQVLADLRAAEVIA